MILAWDNIWDQGVVSETGGVPGLPGANTQHPHLSRKWQTIFESADIFLDLGTPKAAALLAVLGSSVVNAATFRLRASNIDQATGELLDTGNQTNKFSGGACYELFGNTTARYWRLFVANNGPPNIEIGRIVLAPYWNAAKHLTYGWTLTRVDRSIKRSVGHGQEYSEIRPAQRQLSFTLAFATEAEMWANAYVAAAASGLTKDILAVPQIASGFRWEQAVWGTIVEPPVITHDSANQYRIAFTLLERL